MVLLHSKMHCDEYGNLLGLPSCSSDVTHTTGHKQCF